MTQLRQTERRAFCPDLEAALKTALTFIDNIKSLIPHCYFMKCHKNISPRASGAFQRWEEGVAVFHLGRLLFTLPPCFRSSCQRETGDCGTTLVGRREESKEAGGDIPHCGASHRLPPLLIQKHYDHNCTFYGAFKETSDNRKTPSVPPCVI